jgi:stress response protein SCP2
VTALARGENRPLPGDGAPVTVTVGCAWPLDVSALLLGTGGRVRSDADFVFFNQPLAPGVSLHHGQGRGDVVRVDPGAVPADVATVVVIASLDGSGPPTFAGAGPVEAGIDPLTFPMTGLTTESAVVCVEVYRRGDQWKVRAVGQGYADGLGGIATDFGITVEEPAAAAPAPPPPPPASQKINLDKGRVSLAKRQTVSLTKTGAPPLRRVAMGLGWDPAAAGRSIDLDASAIAIDRRGKKADSVWFMSKSAFRGAIEHSGDNLTGDGAGDDETITVALDALPADVDAVVFVVNSFHGQKFTEVRSAYCRLLDLDSGAELVRFDLTDSKPSTGVVMSVLRRAGAAWEMTAIGEFHDGKTARAMYKPAEEVVRALGSSN